MRHSAQFKPNSRRVWYGRDAIGRRSLLIARSADDVESGEATHAHGGAGSSSDADAEWRRRFALSSVADTLGAWPGCAPIGLNDWQEVRPGVHCFDLRTGRHELFAWTDKLLSDISLQSRERVLVPCDRDPCDASDGRGHKTSGDAAQASPGDASLPRHRSLPPPVPPGLDEHTRSVLRALDAAVAIRVRAIRQSLIVCAGGIHGSSNSTAAPTPFAIGFSGGVDSCILAALLDRHLPPHCAIDLANVSFDGEAAPDRINARAALSELTALAPRRLWRLICIDVSQGDADAVRPRVTELITPGNTFMDLNIGTALWYAAKAEGYIETGGASAPYRSPAKVFFVGTGIDEQAAGYGRHFSKFRDAGWTGLQEELSLDVRRLWSRNLGRDDRLVADHGREARHPFLDEDFMAALLAVPLEIVADLRLPRGEGDKRIVREVAAALGLHVAARRVKRAIQFGSRVAKLSNRRYFGSNRAANAARAGSHRLIEADVGGNP